ncbi:MAG: PIN domain-containing protein [Cyanobacteriota bacterium]|nr:PIN domain-containing protein [Cyanobacteriota bacterium]
MRIVDANIVLRYILDDHAELSPTATEILEQQTALLPIEVACEVVYVLQKVYCINRKDIQEQLTSLLNEKLINMDKPLVFLKALELYSITRLDFVDSLLWAYHVIEQQEVFTFDKKLNKYIGQTGLSLGAEGGE